MDPILEKYFSSKKASIEGELKTRFKRIPVSEKLDTAMRYSLFSDGKRFRPILAIASCESVGGAEKDVLPFACALELIHTYSLIHDDLPAMDNDDLRRGQPTNHKVYGEDTAILAGDALLTLAFEIASQPKEGLNPSLQLEIIDAISEAGGAFGMVGGQQLDLDGEDKKLNLDELKKIHLHKTGKLIQCATKIGAIAGGADQKQTISLCNYGENIGLAFQITDDILDFTGKLPGKNPKGDIKNKKSTFATLLGLEKSKEILNKAVSEAKKSLNDVNGKNDILKSLADFIHNRVK